MIHISYLKSEKNPWFFKLSLHVKINTCHFKAKSPSFKAAFPVSPYNQFHALSYQTCLVVFWAAFQLQTYTYDQIVILSALHFPHRGLTLNCAHYA